MSRIHVDPFPGGTGQFTDVGAVVIAKNLSMFQEFRLRDAFFRTPRGDEK